ncbi:NAD(P)H-dependent flavin oxidoreductase [Pseudalkalibacillus caeni]|uniref:Probable nitronate monooxygenase n=1 Tax=Exobacillus caeni TaxID=2574798 RepID=A0A5R9FC17_9BACL|nr:nitronate monooxygenase [Pseudalkalibacillus caeni]TLS38104.1 2-nitropropane dioxygenase [Pseudalkalibacillus caeni]
MNKLCRLLDISFPIIQGGMGNISNAPLTAAVSEAGGLGTIGAGTMAPAEVEEILKEAKRRTSRPIALNIPLSVTPYVKELGKLVFKHNIPVVSLSAGNPAPYIPKFKEKGVKVICVVASVKHAIKAEQAGADMIVAEGYEAAGINSNLETTTLTLIPQIVKAVSIPVAAAGGVGNGNGLAAVLSLGAQGVQMGTRFIATKEAPVHQLYKEHILNASDTETHIVGRSAGKIRRLLKTPYSQKLLELEKNGLSAEEFQNLTNEEKHKIGALEGRLDEGFINGGQISGLIDSAPSVKEVIEKMIEEAKEAADNASEQLKQFTSTQNK